MVLESLREMYDEIDMDPKIKLAVLVVVLIIVLYIVYKLLTWFLSLFSGGGGSGGGGGGGVDDPAGDVAGREENARSCADGDNPHYIFTNPKTGKAERCRDWSGWICSNAMEQYDFTEAQQARLLRECPIGCRLDTGCP